MNKRELEQIFGETPQERRTSFIYFLKSLFWGGIGLFVSGALISIVK